LLSCCEVCIFMCFDFFVLIWFLGSCLIIISGNNYSCFCKNDSGGFKKDLASWVLPFLGCLLSAPEVKLSFPLTLLLLVYVYVIYVSLRFWFDFYFYFCSWIGLIIILQRSGLMLTRYFAFMGFHFLSSL
jgi:hypothetical protein